MLVILLVIHPIVAQTGAIVEVGTPETAGVGTAENVTAEGGNITEVNLSMSSSQTIHWQGFWGQVSGAISLRDAANNVMYNWSAGTVSGNVYISNESSFTWASITAAAASVCDSITGTDSDSCTNTFNDGTKTYTVAGETVNTVPIVQTFDSSGSGAWDEGVIDVGGTTVYAATIYNNADTFKSGTADFQAIVPVDGENTRLYYFWVELGV